jgi:hypothetical protein
MLACVNVIIVESFEPRLALYKKIISKGDIRQGYKVQGPMNSSNIIG